MSNIPIVFAFDDNYALPASIAISSLLKYKKKDTEYTIYVFHGGLKKSTMEKIETITPINWIKVEKNMLPKVEIGWSGLETYYRLLIPNLLPQHDKIIWSDVDVLFQDDLSDIFNEDLSEYDWAGIKAERQDEKNGVHSHFVENKNNFIYMPGFMIINAKKWRQENKFQDFIRVITDFGSKLKMFDLDILNLACHQIKDIPFDYCVLENIYDNDDIQKAPEYPWLSHVYPDNDLLKAKKHPKIIHYAGNMIKIWKRKTDKIPAYYMEYIKQSPIFNATYFYPTLRGKIEISILWCLQKICFIKSWRRNLKQIRSNYRW